MPQAWTIWNKDHDIGIVYWDYRPSDFPLGPVNKILEAFYNQEPTILPYFYAVWRDGQEIGLMISGSMEIPEGEDGDRTFFAMFNDIIESEKAVAELDPRYRMVVWDV